MGTAAADFTMRKQAYIGPVVRAMPAAYGAKGVYGLGRSGCMNYVSAAKIGKHVSDYFQVRSWHRLVLT